MPAPGTQGIVLAYPPSGTRPYVPYKPEEMSEGQSFIDTMASRPRPLSQQELVDYLAQVDIDSPFPRDGFAGFLDMGMYAMSQGDPFREGDEHTVSCILDEDIPEYLQRKRDGDPAAVGLVVPVPRRYASPDPRLGGRLQAAPSACYDSDLGFCVQEQPSA